MNKRDSSFINTTMIELAESAVDQSAASHRGVKDKDDLLSAVLRSTAEAMHVTDYGTLVEAVASAPIASPTSTEEAIIYAVMKRYPQDATPRALNEILEMFALDEQDKKGERLEDMDDDADYNGYRHRVIN